MFFSSSQVGTVVVEGWQPQEGEKRQDFVIAFSKDFIFCPLN